MGKVGPARVVDESANDLAALGVPAEQIAQMVDAEDIEPDESIDFLEVLPANWDAVRVFIRCETQWRAGPMGGLLGLDYPGVEAAMRMMGVVSTPALFEQLRTLEVESINTLAEAAHGD